MTTNVKSASAFSHPSAPTTDAPPFVDAPSHQQYGNHPQQQQRDVIQQQPYVGNMQPPLADVLNVEKGQQHAVLHERAARGEWEHGFWDCFRPGELCFKSCCCGCFVFGKTQHRLEDPSLQTYNSVNAPCGMLCLLNYIGGFGFIYQMMKRGEMRRAYGIRGSGASDCLASCCCPCCVLMQMDKEVVSRQEQGMAHHQQGYVAPGGMAAVPH